MANVQALNSKIYGMYSAARKMAVKEPTEFKKFLEIDSFKKQVNGCARELAEFSPKTARELVTPRGKFTDAGKDAIRNMLKKFNLPETATWDDIFSAAGTQYKERQKKLAEAWQSNFVKEAKLNGKMTTDLYNTLKKFLP